MRALILLAGCWFLLGNARLHAEAAVSNLEEAGNASVPVQTSSTGAAAWTQSFTTGVDRMQLLRVVLAMSGRSVDAAGAFRVDLYADGAGLPKALLLPLTSSPASAASGLCTYQPSTTYTLQPYTTYWVVAQPLSQGHGPDCQWVTSSDATDSPRASVEGWSLGPSAQLTSSAQGAPTWEQQRLPLRLEIDAQSVPVPASLAFAAVGITAAILGRFFRQGS